MNIKKQAAALDFAGNGAILQAQLKYLFEGCIRNEIEGPSFPLPRSVEDLGTLLDAPPQQCLLHVDRVGFKLVHRRERAADAGRDRLDLVVNDGGRARMAGENAGTA
jgi:hypothetical protein